jgi:uncharacterized delta-60 repeat protein
MKNSVLQTTLKLSTFLFLFLCLFSPADAAGVLDRSFGANGRVTTPIGGSPYPRAVIVQPDGKILVAGDAEQSAGRAGAFVRYNPDGSLDQSFGFGGKFNISYSSGNTLIYALALQPDGKIVAVGSTTVSPGGATDFLIARFDDRGIPDSSFGNLGFLTINQGTCDFFYGVAVQPDGKIVAVGSTSDGGRAAAIRFNANGTLDQSFAAGGLFYIDIPNTSDEGFASVAVYPNGRIVAGGLGTAAGIDASLYLVALQPNGSLAPDFGTQGLVVINEPAPPVISLGFDMAVAPDGKIITVSAKIRKFLANGAVDTTFNTNTFGVEPRGNRLALRPDGKFATVRYELELDTVIRNANGRFIGKAKGLIGNDIAAQPDNKLVLISSAGSEFSVTRLSAITSQATRLMDFNRDERTDLGVYQPGSGVDFKSFRFLNSDNSQFSLFLQTTRLVPEYSLRAEQNGAFSETLTHWWRGVETVSRPMYYEVKRDGQAAASFAWGLPEDIPTGGDFNGDTITDLTVFRPSNGTWYAARGDNNTYSIVQWGISGDKPVAADYDYDGKTDYAVYRPSTGTWWILRSSDGGSMAVRFGIASDIPLTGDYDGDGRADLTVYRPSEGNWYHLLTTEGFKVVRWGLETDVPVPGDYDGDGRHDQAIYRNGLWYLLQSTNGIRIVSFGSAGELPVSVRYDQ